MERREEGLKLIIEDIDNTLKARNKSEADQHTPNPETYKHCIPIIASGVKKVDGLKSKRKRE